MAFSISAAKLTCEFTYSGTLSFALNHKELGVAVEGLSGPLYPAFSLYNEGDQISLLPQKSISDGLGWSASAAERVLDRFEVSRNSVQL